MSSPSHEIYESLCRIFTERKSKESLEIEIVSPEQGPLVRDGSCIGISKKALAKAFIIARQRFATHLIQRNNTSAALSTAEGVQDLAVATEIILLFDCEHVTACNWRKRLIISALEQQKYPAVEHDVRILEDIFERERSLMTTFLCSPLHRHTKSPTLWQHRLWILTEMLKMKAQQQSATSSSERSDNFLRELVLEEFDVVCKAGQLHPRNYYAFGYMRQVHTLIAQSALTSTKNGLSEISTSTSALSLELALVMVEPMLKWCLSNPSDISGWTYLFYLLSHGHDEDDVFLKNGSFDAKRKLVMDRTIHFAVQITTWEGESLWTFVDLMLAKFGDNVLPEKGILDDSHPRTASERENLLVARWQKSMNRIGKSYSGK